MHHSDPDGEVQPIVKIAAGDRFRRYPLRVGSSMDGNISALMKGAVCIDLSDETD